MRIHRGAAEVGGTVIELEAGGDRLVLEAGLPLSLDDIAYRDLQPDVPGLWADGDGSLKGVIISHGHPDHYGLADLVAPSVPIYMGAKAKSIIDEAAFFTGKDPGFTTTGPLENLKAIQLGKFEVTPALVDHSGFDAYALLLEVDGKKVFYTGDLRGHGRKSATFERLVEQPPEDIDCLLLEGTNVGRDAGVAIGPSSEEGLQHHLVDRFAETPGMALAFYSAQNIDRLVTVYKAAVASGRQLVLDLYGASIAAATGTNTIPQAGWEGVKVFVPMNQRIRVKESREFWRVNAVKSCRVFSDEIAEAPERWVMTSRSSYLGELDRSVGLEGAVAFWMMWSGYLEREGPLNRSKLPVELAHVSGHATEVDLARLVDAIRPKQVAPIHSNFPDAFSDRFSNVSAKANGEWWSV